MLQDLIKSRAKLSVMLSEGKCAVTGVQVNTGSSTRSRAGDRLPGQREAAAVAGVELHNIALPVVSEVVIDAAASYGLGAGDLYGLVKRLPPQAARQLLKDFTREYLLFEFQAAQEALPTYTPIYPADQKKLVRNLEKERGQPLLDFLQKHLHQDTLEYIGGKRRRTYARGELVDWSALECIHDAVRTRKFLDALDCRLQQLGQQKAQNEEMRIIDAGCGPAPIYGIKAALSDPRVRVTCLEVNRISVKKAGQMVKKFGLADRIEIVPIEATQYRAPGPVDGVISETMDFALRGENLVHILDHLAQFVAPHGFIIPERIELEQAFVDHAKLTDAAYYCCPWKDVEPVITSHFSCFQTWSPGTPLEKIKVGPPPAEARGRDALVRCRVILCSGSEEIVLEGNDSYLTRPMNLNVLKPDHTIEYVPDLYHQTRRCLGPSKLRDFLSRLTARLLGSLSSDGPAQADPVIDKG